MRSSPVQADGGRAPAATWKNVVSRSTAPSWSDTAGIVFQSIAVRRRVASAARLGIAWRSVARPAAYSATATPSCAAGAVRNNAPARAAASALEIKPSVSAAMIDDSSNPTVTPGVAPSDFHARAASSRSSSWPGPVRSRLVETNPARASARWTSGAPMNNDQTKPVRTFSACSSVIPRSMPMTSGLTHPVSGLKASTKP